MKQLSFVLLAITALIVESYGATPAKKCREGDLRKTEVCILHCEYSHYGFAGNNFKIDEKHTKKLTDILIQYGGVAKNKAKDIRRHLRNCANEALARSALNKDQKCTRVIDYYRCAVKTDLFSYTSYATAVIKYDKTINV
ncbi:uncharacterized protein LOC132266054 [Phlebotomus argentipes]|uniref:13.6 kDa salivary protein SP02 n=1 Tax=Phlebotomus argentipes TaxID=94469 RepID=Q0ZSU7_PHLAR|nr:uncharacterized protein LOC132266054 [Phlebotomus argentipes]ABA12134.1 13.6 kDa salivary protein SP02 [Phlebotomus argentipes]